MRNVRLLLCALLGIAGFASAQTSTLVKKTADAFDGPVWQLSQWNTGAGEMVIADQAAPDSASKKSMEIRAKFTGKGFEAVSVLPQQPLIIPGDMKSLTIRARRSDLRGA